MRFTVRKEEINMNVAEDKRFEGIEPFEKKVWLSTPTMHGEKLQFVQAAIDANWVSTVGENINISEKEIAEKIGRKYAVGLASGTSALHLAVKLCGEKLYGQPKVGHGALEGRKVFCSDMTFDATVNPVVYEGGEPVFIDTEYDTWNMDPVALEKAFELYPNVRLVVVAHLYVVPGKMREIREICSRHHALIVEDVAESLGATYQEVQTESFGDAPIISLVGVMNVTDNMCRKIACFQ